MQKSAGVLSLVLLCFGLLGCDHATKLVAERGLGAGRVVTLVPNVLELRYTRNHDVAFSALSRWDFPGKATVLLGVSLLVLAATIVLWIRYRRRTPAVSSLGPSSRAWGPAVTMVDVGYAFVLAGAFGNVADRLLRGYVVDFIHLAHWPVFNVADACIVVGLIALGLSRSRARAAPA